ncbi:hypothetical protein Slu03_27720 [Sediminihabitans luteus]|uniref:YlbL family protein n=1 Tax=Sediminihabitans luteus TaxID=1138585 RepID=UPI001A519112|nr:S16 family serine protease [Sediminihabitans luteus]GIJ00395.1 hypothetical protein Slu03_27720 [Sediminihabitans luteus]
MSDERPTPDPTAGPVPGPAAASDTDVTEDYEPEPATRRATTLAASLLATLAIVAVMAFLPAPYAVRGPGPTEDVLGAQDGQELIQIKDEQTYPATGELRLVTVSVSGGPGFPADALTVLRGWVDEKRSVVPVESVFDLDQSREEVDAENQAEMTSSQESATVAALTELGYTVPATLTVVGTVEGSGAEGVVADGDVLTSVDGDELVTYDDLVDDLAKTSPGDDVELGVTRDGEPTTVTVTMSDIQGRTSLGVYLDQQFDLPVDVQIQIEDIGGPSAGTMFALGIIDKLTPEDEANGHVIAGTGTMSVDGQVGAIGGIRQKLYGAQRDGATWFLAPTSNCNEVVGNVPDGMHVTAVSTLTEALAAVTAIGQDDTDGLPTCEQAVEGKG